MIDKFCEYLTNKIRKEMPEIDDEKAEVIMYGIQLIIGEIPKIVLMFLVAAVLRVFWQTILAFFLILPYKIVSGGVHLKTHLGCFIMTNLVYCGNAIISTNLTFSYEIKLFLIILNATLGIIMITLYAPADTVNMPILRKKERENKKILSYVFLTANMMVALFITNTVISNILIIGTLIQTCSITRVAFKIAKNEYGYETYMKQKSIV